MTDYLLSGHKCKPIARMKMGEGRDWWLGELTEPIDGYPNESHCLHIKTPLKEVVLGVNLGDMEQLAVLCHIVCGPINPTWIDHMAKAFQKRAAVLIPRALAGASCTCGMGNSPEYKYSHPRSCPRYLPRK